MFEAFNTILHVMTCCHDLEDLFPRKKTEARRIVVSRTVKRVLKMTALCLGFLTSCLLFCLMKIFFIGWWALSDGFTSSIINANFVFWEYFPRKGEVPKDLIQKNIIWLYSIESVDDHCLSFPTKKRKTGLRWLSFPAKKDEVLYFSTWKRSYPCSLEISVCICRWNFATAL